MAAPTKAATAPEAPQAPAAASRAHEVVHSPKGEAQVVHLKGLAPVATASAAAEPSAAAQVAEVVIHRVPVVAVAA